MRKLVKRKIEQAFPIEPIPAASVVVEDTYCVEHLHEILGGRKWTDVGPVGYRHCSDGFSLLTVAGLHYYLPGYMVAELESPDEADVVAMNWTFTLGGNSDFDRTRMEELGKVVSLDQIDAIALWIGYYANTYESNEYIRRSYERLEAWATGAESRRGDVG